MRKVRLIRGLDYRGHGVYASKKNPIIETDDERAAALVQGGFFAPCESLVEPTSTENQDAPGESAPDTGTPEHDPRLDDMTVEELKAYAASLGIDISGLKKKAALIAAIAGE